MSGPNPAPPRIAIKFSAVSSSRPRPTSSLGKRPRPQLLHAESDSEQEDEWTSARHEPIATIAAAPGSNGGNGGSRHTGTPLSIPPKQTSHERISERGPRAKRATGEQAEASEAAKDTPNSNPRGQQPLRWGLTLKNDHAGASQTDQTRTDAASDDSDTSSHHASGERQSSTKGPPFTTVDDEALGALLNSEDTPAKGGHVIANLHSQDMTEGDVFRRHFRDAPEVSTLKEYEEMPVEEFGGALLRGMGWDGKLRGPKSKDYQRRPNQIGLGAKALNGREDLGSWNQKANEKSRPRLTDYNRQKKEKREGARRDQRP
ncbi:pre-mRNA-splicing factor SPP2 [Magnaporthiopsis poae ATCC 64411]|uniref:Pre-mRNA-splicing factor n=1 Tax=Magnaporthiopsis poae (strain ATCC 64411 / 73-15) TaxID=644358 RepID=A0A0C4E6A1_MAGP6|nr:pre-mRNA-splicing factor SPP2 [Magnaporthiopsis poae ATCC 64411]